MRGQRWLVTLLAAACLLLVGISPCWGQTAATGQITGTVFDPQKAAVARAAVTAKEPSTGLTRQVMSSAAGDYSLPLLPPGSYAVTVEAAGFETQTSTNINVQVATTTTLDFSLRIGAGTQQVRVEATAELLQLKETANGDTTTGRTVSELPLTNRNYTQILGLNPGVASVVPNAAALGKNNVDVNVNGSRVMDNSYEMDGQDLSNLETQGTTNTVSIGGISVPSPDAIQEFKVQTSLYDAAYGRGSGANVDVVTKSGTDSIHGDLFEFLRNTALDANDYFLN